MTPFNKTILSTVLIAALLPVAAMAQSYKNQGYLVDGSGSIVTSPTAGLCWRTGDWTPALAVAPCDPVISTAVPLPVAKAAEVAPAPLSAVPAAIVAVKPMSQKMSFSADALFAFDKAALKPEGKTMLNDLVQQLNGASYDSVLVTGHADRIGRAAYNQKLSVQRADEVKAYLVGQNIPASRVIATGKGESEPVTKAGECVGKTNAKLITCLQPDRRVDVEMTGTKQP
jgi:OOP family OmpA-OmpF porin